MSEVNDGVMDLAKIEMIPGYIPISCTARSYTLNDRPRDPVELSSWRERVSRNSHRVPFTSNLRLNRYSPPKSLLYGS